MSTTSLRLLATAIRNALKLGGFGGVLVSDDFWVQLLSAWIALTGLLWSAYRDVREGRAASVAVDPRDRREAAKQTRKSVGKMINR